LFQAALLAEFSEMIGNILAIIIPHRLISDKSLFLKYQNIAANKEG